jgi:hypothetical protein
VVAVPVYGRLSVSGIYAGQLRDITPVDGERPILFDDDILYDVPSQNLLEVLVNQRNLLLRVQIGHIVVT